MKKRIMSMFCAVLLLVSMIPTSVFAEEVVEAEKPESYDAVVEAFNDSSNIDDAVSMEEVKDLEFFNDVGDYSIEEEEPNNSMDYADFVFSDATVGGTLSKSDLIDYYYVVVTSRSEVMLVSAADKQDFMIGIADAYGEPFIVGEDLGYEEGYYTDAIVVTLDPGVYHIIALDVSDAKSNVDYGFYYVETPVGVERLSGADRYQTSQKIFNRYNEIFSMDKADTVVLASGNNFADALAGSYLAATCGAPIYIVNDNFDINWFKKNVSDGADVYILGGTVAVSQKVEDKLGDYNVERIAGADRYATNIEILKKGYELSESMGEILVCTGTNFADSLSGSATGLPILLVGNKGLTAAQKDFLSEVEADGFYVLGGPNAVKSEVKAEIAKYGPVERISGETRFETSVKIAETFFPGAATAVLAYAQNFPDGLCGGPVANVMYAPLILTAKGQEALAAKYTKENNIRSGLVLGGTSVLPDATAKKIFGVNRID